VGAEEVIEDGSTLNPGLEFILNGELGIEFQFVEVVAYQAKAECVKGRDVCGVEEGALFGDPGVFGFGGDPGVQADPEAVAHFGGGGLVESDDENSVEGAALGVVENAIKDSSDERAGFAGPGAGHHEDVAFGLDGSELLAGGGRHAGGEAKA